MKTNENIMELSTAHITPATAKLLDECAINSISYFIREYGYFLSTMHLNEDNMHDCPDDLKQCIRYAQDNECTWLLLDGDVDPMPEDLPVYDWDAEATFPFIDAAWALDDIEVANELAAMLMDDDISTAYMMQDIAVSYTPDKSQEFRDGFDRAFEILLARNVKTVCEHLIKTCKKSDDEEGGGING